MLFGAGYISMQWIWLGLVVVFTIIELCTYSLHTIWLAIAALVMVFLSLLLDGLSTPMQGIIFLVISALLLIYTRPLAVKKFKVGKIKTNVDSLVGLCAPVTKAIGEFEKGETKVNGQIWTAISHDGSPIAAGTRCEILRIEGVKLVVKPVPADAGFSEK